MKELLQDSKVLVFQLKEQEFAIPITFVRSIEVAQAITRIPFTVPYIKGITHLRGAIVPVIELAQKLQIPIQNIGDQTRIIIVSVEETEIGLLVDMVNDVFSVSPSSIKEPTAKQEFLQSEWISGVTVIQSRFVTILDIEKMVKIDMTQHRNEGTEYVVY